MTGREILDKAVRLLGYTDSLGNMEMSGRIKSRAITVINFIYSDLFYLLKKEGFVGIKELGDEIYLPERLLNDIMPYGVAALIAQSEGDGDQQYVFIKLYNAKRAGAAGNSNIVDILPIVQ